MRMRFCSGPPKPATWPDKRGSERSSKTTFCTFRIRCTTTWDFLKRRWRRYRSVASTRYSRRKLAQHEDAVRFAVAHVKHPIRKQHRMRPIQLVFERIAFRAVADLACAEDRGDDAGL